jgi:branched-chain amino acid transport system substrate-binding protein
MSKLGRRTAIGLGAAGAASLAVRYASAADKTLTIGMSVPLTGELAQQSRVVSSAVRFAIDEANAKGGVAGYKVGFLLLDDGSATTGQYDPALAATNARRMVDDASVIAAVGPLNSGSAKAAVPVLSQAEMATVSGSATNPDLNDPKFFSVYHPGGKPNFFRTVTTDAYQGPGLANQFAEVLKINTVTVLDDGGAYGVGMADAFAKQATKQGMKVVIRDRLDPLNADYTAVLTRARSLGAGALYYGGAPLAGAKVAKQSYDILPRVAKGGGDGVHTPDMLTGSGMPAIQGWYATSAAAHVLDEPKIRAWAAHYKATTGQNPADYTVTYYDAAQVILDAVRRVAAAGLPLTRDAVRAAILNTRLTLLQGPVAFDQNGDLTSKVVSIFQVQYNPNYELGDVVHQFRYVGPAPAV